MINSKKKNYRFVLTPDGNLLTLADLPPPSTQRWVISRKAQVVAAVLGGLISVEDACNTYTLTLDEFICWQESIDRHGIKGLRATKIKDYR